MLIANLCAGAPFACACTRESKQDMNKILVLICQFYRSQSKRQSCKSMNRHVCQHSTKRSFTKPGWHAGHYVTKILFSACRALQQRTV